MKILITGCAGFIGFSLTNEILKKNIYVVGIDNLNNYYDRNLKLKRLNILKKFNNFKFIKVDIRKVNTNLNKISNIEFDYLYHFAAQPGVRYSFKNPKLYYDTNVKGFFNVVSTVNKKKLKKIIYASSSSVYGDQLKFPIKENAKLRAKNPYGATKIQNEKMSEKLSKKFNIDFIGLRFFTVYGEWGRPDMFIIKLLKAIHVKKYFHLNNSGDHYRDFTYIKDVTNICFKLIRYNPKNKHTIFNICAGSNIYINGLVKEIRKKFPEVKIKNIKANRADVYKTFGCNKKIKNSLKIKKFFNIKFGLKKTIDWFKKNKLVINYKNT